jgi:hypothetical protein
MHSIKKAVRYSCPQQGMSVTKLSLGGNTLYMTSLLPRESLVSDILPGTGISKSFFYGVCGECTNDGEVRGASVV